MTVERFAHLRGISLAPGSIVIDQVESLDLDSVLGQPWSDRTSLHPLHAYVAAQRGIGTSISALCELADFDIDDGPMMGTLEIVIERPLLSGVRYFVTGEIVDLERKQRRSGGFFDLLTYRERLATADGGLAATMTNSFVLIRPQA